MGTKIPWLSWSWPKRIHLKQEQFQDVAQTRKNVARKMTENKTSENQINYQRLLYYCDPVKMYSRQCPIIRGVAMIINETWCTWCIYHYNKKNICLQDGSLPVTKFIRNAIKIFGSRHLLKFLLFSLEK